MSTMILENAIGFSKQDHNYWTLFGDETQAYDKSTLLYLKSFDDAYFPDGMGAIEGWALSVYEIGYPYPKYHYILADCEESQRENDDPDDDMIQTTITVNRSIWLPIHHWLGYDCNLRDNPPAVDDKDRFIDRIRHIM